MHFLLSRLRCAARALIRSRRLEASVAPDQARAALALLLGLSGMSTQAQTCGMPGRDGTAASSGVVNTYYTPANGSYGPSILSIGLGASQGATTPVAPGDLVVVMQTQCANIDSINSSNQGAGDGTGRGYTEPGTCQAGRYDYLRAGAATSASGVWAPRSPGLL